LSVTTDTNCNCCQTFEGDSSEIDPIGENSVLVALHTNAGHISRTAFTVMPCQSETKAVPIIRK